MSPPKAEEDNPDPSKLAPVSVIGWENLKSRLVGQQKEMQKMADFVAVGCAAAMMGAKTQPAGEGCGQLDEQSDVPGDSPS